MLKTIEKPKTLKEQALTSLRNAITLGVFKPGQHLVERKLCGDLGVSRTVVRECIRHLESEKLIVCNPNPTVTILNLAEVQEIYQIRLLLETAAVGHCASRATPETIKQLNSHWRKIVDALANEDIIEVIEQTTAFYRVIFITGDKIISWDLVRWLNSRIGRLRALTLSTSQRIDTGPENLKNIVNAIENKDSKQAIALCTQHVEGAFKMASNIIQQQEATHHG